MTPIGYGLSRTLRHGDNGLFSTPEGYMNSIVHVPGQMVRLVKMKWSGTIDISSLCIYVAGYLSKVSSPASFKASNTTRNLILFT